MVVAWAVRKLPVQKKRLKGKFPCIPCVPISIMDWQRHIQPLVSSASKYGFIEAIFFPANAVKSAKRRKLSQPSPRLLHVMVSVVVATVALGTVPHVSKATGHEARGKGREQTGGIEATVVHAIKATDHVPRVETVVNRGIVPHAHRATDLRVHRVTGRHVRRATVVLGIVPRVRKETDHRATGGHDLRVHRVTDRHVHRATVLNAAHVESRRPMQLMQAPHLQRLLTRPRHLRQHQKLAITGPLRASSRGELSQCYWHRHVQNIAASIAVA